MAVVHLTVDELNDWLQNQPANTVDTPYEIDVTDLDYVYNDFVKILIDNPTKYVDLSPTTCNTTQNFFFFYDDGGNKEGCTSLIVPPTIHGLRMNDIYAGNLSCSFFGCTNLKKLVIDYIDYDQLLEDIESATWMLPDVFRHCDNLTTFEVDAPYEWKNILIALQERDAFDNDPANCTYRPYSEVVEVPFSDLNNELATWSVNTAQTPYKLNVTELTANDLGQSSTSGTLGYVLTQNDTKYVDLSSTEIPNTVVELRATFKNCTSLVQVFDIPSSVTNMSSCFYRCTSLISAPIIPNSVTYMRECFYDCSSLSTISNIPNSVNDMSSCFFRCTSLTTAPEIRSSRNMENCFYGCTSLTTAPVIFSAISMGNCFRECTSLITVPILPNLGGGGIRNCFYGCSALEEITLCEADLESLVNNNKAENCFYGCTSLTKIGVPPSDQPAESDWHAFRLKFDASTVQGKVYDQTGTAVTIPQSTVTKSTLKLPIKTDELWFPSGLNDNEIDAIIEKVIQYRYTYWNDNDVLDPAEKNFVLWADNPTNVKSNLKGMNPVDTIQSGNMNPVTSNAVANSNAMPVNSVTSGNMHSVTSGAVYSAIDDLYNTYGSASNLNSVTKFAVSYTTATANRPNSYGVCFTFGRFIDFTSAGESRWYYQLAFDTSGYIYTRCAINPTSSTTTPNNWGAWKMLAFA